jgi:hypothetical protein
LLKEKGQGAVVEHLEATHLEHLEHQTAIREHLEHLGHQEVIQEVKEAIQEVKEAIQEVKEAIREELGVLEDHKVTEVLEVLVGQEDYHQVSMFVFHFHSTESLASANHDLTGPIHTIC